MKLEVCCVYVDWAPVQPSGCPWGPVHSAGTGHCSGQPIAHWTLISGQNPQRGQLPYWPSRAGRWLVIRARHNDKPPLPFKWNYEQKNGLPVLIQDMLNINQFLNVNEMKGFSLYEQITAQIYQLI